MKAAYPYAASWRALARQAADIALGVLLLAIAAITLAATANRYLWGGALPWAEELSMLLWVWMIQIAALRAVHVRVDFITDRLPPPLRRTLAMATAVACIAVLVLLTRSAIGMARFSGSDHFIALSGVSRQWLYVPLAIVGPLWAIRIVLESRHFPEQPR